MTKHTLRGFHMFFLLTCGAQTSLGCGNGDTEDTEVIADDPIVPTFGANAPAYEAMGFDTVFAAGTTGSGVTVCVIDTGIDATHPAFAHVVERNRLTWKDFTAEASSSPTDTNGHGTHVAGIIAMNDELTGGAPLVNLLIARVFTESGGSDDITIANAVEWCTDKASDVISMSLGGLTLPAINALLSQDAPASEDAVERALGKGIHVVAAAGNTEITRDVATPANVPGVIAVGALDQDLQTKASFSQSGLNDGPLIPSRQNPNRKPETSAPGVGITSAIPEGSTLSTDVAGCSGVPYCLLSGTSQATPFVSAALALALEAIPTLQHDQSAADAPADNIASMKQALSLSTSPLPGQNEPHDDGVGYGLLQVPSLIENLQQTPNPK